MLIDVSIRVAVRLECDSEAFARTRGFYEISRAMVDLCGKPFVIQTSIDSKSLRVEVVGAPKQKQDPPARLQIVNWRGYGDDESYVFTVATGSGDDTKAVELVTKQYCEDKEVSIEEFEALKDQDEAETKGLAVYINDEMEFHDGQEIEGHGGKKFRIRIEEL